MALCGEGVTGTEVPLETLLLVHSRHGATVDMELCAEAGQQSLQRWQRPGLGWW